MKTPSQPLGVFAILREGLKTPFRNGKIFLSIALALLIPSSLMFLLNDFAIKPLIMDILVKSYTMKSADPQSPEYTKLIDGIRKDAGIFFSEEMLFMVIGSVVSLFVAAATIYSSAMTYSGKSLAKKELLVRIGRTWKQPVITWLYISLFNFGCLLFILALIGILSITVQGSLAITCVVLVLALLLLRVYVYLIVVWKMGIVVSVLEEGTYGMEALAKAAELIRGRKRQGYVLFVLFQLVGLPVFWVLSTWMQDIHRTQVSTLAIGVVMVSFSCLENILMSVVYTVFYFECKKSHGEKVVIEGESGYSLVPNNTHVEDSLI